MTTACIACFLLAASGWQGRTLQQGRYRMEIVLERMQGNTWRTIDPGLVLAQGDRVRFRFRTNFDGFLYVTDLNSSGVYQQLFPSDEAGQDNRVGNNRDYHVPATSAVFRVAGPPGYETVYWLVTPAVIKGTAPSARPVPPDYKAPAPLKLTPRCDDAILRARGDCVDAAAGPKLIPRGTELPQPLADAAGQGPRDLLFLREQEKSIVSSPAPLEGPVVYEFRLAHR